MIFFWLLLSSSSSLLFKTIKKSLFHDITREIFWKRKQIIYISIINWEKITLLIIIIIMKRFKLNKKKKKKKKHLKWHELNDYDDEMGYLNKKQNKFSFYFLIFFFFILVFHNHDMMKKIKKLFIYIEMDFEAERE